MVERQAESRATVVRPPGRLPPIVGLLIAGGLSLLLWFGIYLICRGL